MNSNGLAALNLQTLIRLAYWMDMRVMLVVMVNGGKCWTSVCFLTQSMDLI